MHENPFQLRASRNLSLPRQSKFLENRLRLKTWQTILSNFHSTWVFIFLVQIEKRGGFLMAQSHSPKYTLQGDWQGLYEKFESISFNWNFELRAFSPGTSPIQKIKRSGLFYLWIGIYEFSVLLCTSFDIITPSHFSIFTRNFRCDMKRLQRCLFPWHFSPTTLLLHIILHVFQWILHFLNPRKWFILSSSSSLRRKWASSYTM